MDFIDRFTEGARRALALSQDSAKEMGHNYVGSEHLLLAIAGRPGSCAARLLLRAGVDQADVLCGIEREIGRGEPGLARPQGLTPRARRSSA